MVGERQSGLERDSRCEEGDAINTRQPNQSAPFTKILAEPMNQIQETSSFSASSKARWRYADYFQFIAKPFQPQPGCVVLVPLSQPASERTTL